MSERKIRTSDRSSSSSSSASSRSLPPSGDIEKKVGDDAVAQQVVAADAEEHYVLTPEDNKRVLRKIDMLVMPFMCIAVFNQFLDKTSLNYANLLGVQDDLGLVGQQYSWLGSIFYFGYLGASPVHGYFLQRVHLSRYLGVNVVLWGVCLLCHAAAFNYAGLVVCRLFLGILEAGVTPGFILLTGRFYRRREQVNRVGLWFVQNGTAQIIGGAISYGILGQSSSGTSVSRWQELFLILGAITTVFGFTVFFFMPASPATAKALTAEERKIAVERIRENKTGINNKEFKWYQLRESLLDVRLYLFFLAVCAANVANGGVTNFGSEIIGAFGYDDRETSLLGMSTGGAEIVAVFLGLFLASWTNTRVVPGVLSFLVAILGGALMLGLPASNAAGRMSGYAIVFWYPVASPFLYSWLSSCIGGTTKKIIFNVVLQVGYCTGNVIGPQTYRASDAPNYVPAKITLILMFVVSAFALVAISGVHWIENKKRDKKGEFGEGEPVDIAFSDQTDKEIRSFRYPY